MADSPHQRTGSGLAASSDQRTGNGLATSSATQSNDAPDMEAYMVMVNDLAQEALQQLPSECKVHAAMPCCFSCCHDDDTLISNIDNYLADKPLGNNMTDNLIPCTMLLAHQIQACPSSQLLRVLLDSSGTATMINAKALPKGCTPKLLDQSICSMTIVGSFDSKCLIERTSLILLEFDHSKTINSHHALVFDGPCQYDIILGHDFLYKTGMMLDFELKKVMWLGNHISMKDPQSLEDPIQQYLFLMEDTDPFDDYDDCFTTQILDAKYEKADPLLCHC